MTHILLVDDDALLRRSLAFNLEQAEFRISTAGSAEDALALVRRDPPNLIVLDIGLPGMDGYELARRLRSELGDETPVLVALTGFGGEEDRRRSREAGFECHLVKPVEPDVLEKVLATLGFAEAQRRNQARAT